MALDPSTFIRRTGVPAVLVYLKALDLKLPDTINNESPPDSVLHALQKLAPNDTRVWPVFENVENFAAKSARTALRSVLINERGLLSIFDAMTETNRECALWLAGSRPDLFEQAVSALNTSKQLGGRSWDAFQIRRDGDNAGPDFSAANLEKFEQLARKALNQSKFVAPDGRLKAVPFRRVFASDASHSQRAWTQVTIYAEGPHETRDRLSEGNEVFTEVLRRVDEGAVLFDPSKSTIEVVVLGGQKIRRHIADAFCSAFMPTDAAAIRIINRDIDFSRFVVDPNFPLLATDPVDALAIDEIRFSLPNSEGALVTFEQRFRATAPSNIYQDARDWPEMKHPEELKSWDVVAVRLRFVFKDDGGNAKPRLRTVELKSPNKSNLREKSDGDHAVMYDLLERWGVFKDEAYDKSSDS